MQQTMMMKKPQDVYKRQGVLTASPVELIIMLYDGLRRNLVMAKNAISKKDVQVAHRSLVKAQDIVSELMGCLDLSFPISKDLLSLYEFILHSLEEVNVKKDPELISPLLEIVGELRDAWSEAADTQRGSMRLEG